MAEKPGELAEIKTGEDDPAIEDRNDEKADKTADIADDPDAIRGQIDETRREMSETIDAIQDKLSIANISAQIKEQVTEHISDAVETVKTTVWDATIGQGGEFMKTIGGEIKRSNIGKMASANPLPFALIGLGIGMLAFNRYYARPVYRGAGSPDDASQSRQNGRESGGITQTISSAANSAYESASGAAGKVLDTAGGAASRVYDTASGAAGTAYHKIGDVGGQLHEQYDYYLEENPLVVGAVALALGAAVGAALPSTRYEGEIMGEARESLVAKAQTAARDAFDKVQEVVGQAKETIIEDAKEVVSQAKDSLTGEPETGQKASA